MTTVDAPALRVLVADDSTESRALLRAMLETITGVDVVGAAANGRQAFHALESVRPDVVFLDIAMPVMDGLEAAVVIRARYPEVKIIVYSAYDRMAMGLAALSAGADEYFEKAATVGQLLDQLRHVFPERTLAAKPRRNYRSPLPEQESERVGETVRLAEPAEGLASAAAEETGRVADGQTSNHADDELLRAAVESLTEAFCLMRSVRDEDGTIVDFEFVVVNPAACAFAGRGPEELLGHRLLELFPAQGPRGRFDNYRQAVETGVPFKAVFQHHADGVDGTFQVSVTKVGDGYVLTATNVSERLQQETALADSERRYRQMLETSQEGVCAIDADDLVTFVNQRAAQMVGYSVQEIMGARIWDFFTNGSLGIATELGQLRRAGRSSAYEMHLRRKDRSTLLALVWVRPIQDAEGNYPGALAMLTDISDRKEPGEQLAAGEHRMRAAFDSMLDGEVILSPVRDEHGGIVDFRFEYINEAGCRLNRMTRERHIGHVLHDVLPGLRESGLFDDLVLAVETGMPINKRSYRYADAFGGTTVVPRVWDISLVALGEGLILKTFRDVTDQASAETERRQSQERLRLAVQTLTEGFFLTRARRDEDGRIVDLEYVIANAAGCRMTDRSEVDFIGHGYLDIWPTTGEGLFDHFCAVVETGVPYTTVLASDPAEGTFGTFEASVTQVGDGCAFVVRDVTERLGHDRALADAHAAAESRSDRLERSNQELQAFASAVSHDLREPLRTTAGFVGLIQDRFAGELPEPARELFGHVLSGAQRLEDRIAAILDYARSGASGAPPQLVRSGEVASAAALDVAGILEEYGVNLHIGELPTIQADAVQLHRVFQNLLTNAAVYHGPVAPHIEISAERLDGHWQFTVADNGPGVPVNARESIFAMFRRGPAAEGHDGHGMGLALSRRIVESYDGDIWVEDNPGGGSRFRFTLPAEAPS